MEKKVYMGRLRGVRFIKVVCGEMDDFYGSSEGERRFIRVVCGEIEGLWGGR